MQALRWRLVGVVGLVLLGSGPAALAEEADGLAMPKLQGRIRLGMGVEPGGVDAAGYRSTAPAKLSGASVLGDYYFDRASSPTGDASGFRATTGVFLGSRLGLWGGVTPSVLSSNLFSVERHSFSLLAPPQAVEGASQDSANVPYVGLGYSGGSLKNGWGFSADLGLMALNPGNAARLGRALAGSQNLDDALRELRLSPILQIGVSYQF
jgi:hypothetical protein